ncbi:MAG: hypothetical protein V7K79_10355 [Nostoc sp.]
MEQVIVFDVRRQRSGGFLVYIALHFRQQCMIDCPSVEELKGWR